MSREQIIAAIRRLAERNDGRPVGLQVFTRETGIRESAWRGRYWARWSDAVREAGFEPNERQQAYPQQVLLAHLRDVLADLGKWPTSAELRLYLRTRPELPSHNTFRRLGTRTEQAQALLDAASDLGAPGNVVALCEQEIAREAPTPADADVTRGFVYLLKSGRHYKIGHSNAPGRRAYEVGLRMPNPIKLIHEIETDDPQGIEEYWHRRFVRKRRRGEWFDLTPEDVAAFVSRGTM